MSKRLRDNFNVRIEQPIDTRFSINDLSLIDRPYNGLITYHEIEDKFYKFSNGVWKDLLQGLNTLISVEIYGAKGDGITNDTLAIQNAIDDISIKGGGILFFPNGTYLSSGITLKNNVLIVGEYKECTIIKRINISTQLHFLTSNTSHNFGISNITIDGSKNDDHSFTYTDSVNIVNSYNFHIKNCNIVNSVNRGIYIQKNTDKLNDTLSLIEDCNLQVSNSVLIQITDCSDIKVNGNNVRNSSDNGIVCNYTESRYTDINLVEISNNVVSDNPKVGIWCYSVTDSHSDRFLEIGRIIINNNVCFNNSWHGIITQVNETMLNGNNVYNNGNAIDTDKGMGITVNTKNASIIGGSIYGNFGAGIDLGDCSDIIIQNVIIKENGAMGIEINSTEDSIVDSCILKNNNTTARGVPFGTNNGITVYHNMQFPDNSRNIQIKNCKITRNSNYYQNFGIYVQSSADNVMLTGNDLYDSGNIQDLKVQNTNYIAQTNITKDWNFALTGSTITLNTGQTTLGIPATGDIFFLELASGASSGIYIDTILTDGVTTPKGRKLTLVINSPYITFKSGIGNIYHSKKVETVYTLTGTSPNYALSSSKVTTNDPDIGGNLVSISYVCIGGTGGAAWVEVSHTIGR